MEKQLKINWKKKGIKGVKELVLYVNGQSNRFEFKPDSSFEVDVPILGENAEIVIMNNHKGNEILCFSRTIPLGEVGEYSCNISFSKYGGFSVQMSKPNQKVTSDDEVYYHSNAHKKTAQFAEAGKSFFFPIYGLYKGFATVRNRVINIVAACIGFFLSMGFSLMAASEDTEIILGLGHTKLIEYAPLSFLDFLINLLAGGILTVMGLLRLFFESLMS